MNYLITGFPGMGKTAIARELVARGCAAYDPETIEGFMFTIDRKTGERIDPPYPVPQGWYDECGAYNWDSARIHELLASEGDVYVCSKAHNQQDFYVYFDKIFVLKLDDTTLTKRLRDRPGQMIGKSQVELDDILRLHEPFESTLLLHGAYAISASPSLDVVVDSILAQVAMDEAGR